MNKRLISLMAAALALLSASGQVVDFTDVGLYPVIEITPENTTGLDKIFVVYDIQGVGMTYTSASGEPVVWYSYDYAGGSLNMDIIDVRHEGNVTILDQLLSNKGGYVIEEGTNRKFYWVVNYADYYLSWNDISFIGDTHCSLLSFEVDGIAPKIPYYTIDGHIEVLDREIELNYNTLVWNDSTHWQEQNKVEKFESLDDGIVIEAPLCNTVFTLSGDRFLKQWGLDKKPKEKYYYTKAVKCNAIAFYLDDVGNIMLDDEGKQMKLEGELTEGSAPVGFRFTGYHTDAVVYRRWEIATDVDFEDVILQFNDDEVDYTFMDAGTYYVRYMVANDAGSCEDYSDSYTITVAESQLGKGARGDLPNVFLPGSDSNNNIWKVYYKSLVEFHCWIFNRWGALVYEYTDPDGGWDGTYKGHLVNPGVYYYVVTATGSDGIKYKKRGDINVLRYKGSYGTMPDSGGNTGGY